MSAERESRHRFRTKSNLSLLTVTGVLERLTAATFHAMLHTATLPRGERTRVNGAAGRPPSRNKQWVAGHVADAERGARGGHRGGAQGTGRGRGGGSALKEDEDTDMVEEEEPEVDELVDDSHDFDHEPELETIEQVREYKKQVRSRRVASTKREI